MAALNFETQQITHTLKDCAMAKPAVVGTTRQSDRQTCSQNFERAKNAFYKRRKCGAHHITNFKLN